MSIQYYTNLGNIVKYIEQSPLVLLGSIYIHVHG